jgi:hypothetical protein
MANISGQGSGWAFVKESTYGTPVTTTKAMPFVSETLELSPNMTETETLKGGVSVRTDSSWRIGYFSGSGSIQTLVYTHGTAALTELMLGGIATTGAGPYVHTASVDDTIPSATMMFTYGGTTSHLSKIVDGVMVDSWEIAVAVGENVTLGLDVVYQDETIATADALDGSYPATQTPFAALDFGTLTIGGTDYCVQNLRVRGSNNLNTGIICVGDTQIQQPVPTGAFRDITGEVEILLDSASTGLYPTFKAGTPAAIVATATSGASIFTINARVRLDGHPVTVGSPDILTTSIPFTITTASTAAAGLSLVTTNTDSTP